MEQENIVHLEPMDRIGVDPFDIGPKAYLAIVDRSSSYVKCYSIMWNLVHTDHLVYSIFLICVELVHVIH